MDLKIKATDKGSQILGRGLGNICFICLGAITASIMWLAPYSIIGIVVAFTILFFAIYIGNSTGRSWYSWYASTQYLKKLIEEHNENFKGTQWVKMPLGNP